MSKTVAECFVFVDFDLYFTETDKAHVGLFESGGSFVRKQLEGGGIYEGV